MKFVGQKTCLKRGILHIKYLVQSYMQPVYKQLALRWQIAEQLSRLNPLSLSNSKNYRLEKSGVFPL